MISKANSPKLYIGGTAVVLLAAFLSLRLPAKQEVPTGIKALPVKTVSIEQVDSYAVRRSFTGRAVARRTSALSFELGGRLTDLTVDIGDTVAAGDVLATLDTSRLKAQLRQTLAEQEEVAANLNLAERTLKRAQETFDRGHSSAQRLDESEANMIALKARSKRLSAAVGAIRIDLDKLSLTAPYAGTIIARTLDEGTVVAAGTRVFEIVENSEIEAHIGMPEKFARASNLKDAVTLYAADGAAITDFQVKSIVPVLDGQTRTMLVTFVLPRGSTAQGELVNAVVDDRIETTGAWLPIRAVSSDVRGLWRVYKVLEDRDGQYVRFENVQILYTYRDRVFVTGTISDGDQIIADGLDRLAPHQRVVVRSTDTIYADK